MQRLKDMEAQTQAKVGRLEKLMETELAKYKAHVEKMQQSKEELNQSREKMYQIVLAFIIFLMLFYVSGYIGSSGNKLMLR